MKKQATQEAATGGKWRSRIVEHAEVDPRELEPHPMNWRNHPPEQQRGLAGVLEEVGWVQDVVVNKRTGRLIDGHLRRDMAIKNGEATVPVVYVDLDEDEERKILATMDPLAALATQDHERRKELLAGIQSDNAGLSELLEQMKMQSGILAETQEEQDTPEPPDDPMTKPGNLWLLGDHRLLCADSSDPAAVDRLLGGAKIHLVNTDPPYNVKVEPRSFRSIAGGNSSFWSGKGPRPKGMTHHQGFDAARNPKILKTKKKLRPKDRTLVNDFVSDEAFLEMLHAWFGNIARVLEPGRVFYIWGGYSNMGNYPPVLKATGLYFSQAIVWVKGWPVLTRKDFLGNHEWCFYGWREGAAHQFFGPNNVTDVWDVKKLNPQSMVHLTEKPVELAVRAIQYSSKPKENVLDLFGGSGSTLIGAEQTGRQCFTMELDPAYCDVIIERWQTATGEKAQLET